MNTREILSERNQRTFSQAIVRQEFQSITKERSHLSSKALQRQLNSWEKSRLSEIETMLLDVARQGLEVLALTLQSSDN